MCQGMGFVWVFSGSDNLELGKHKAVKLWLQGTVSLQRMVSDGLSLISCSSDAAALVGSGPQTHGACFPVPALSPVCHRVSFVG